MYSSKFISIYVHWPFCIKKCPYCNFNTYLFNAVDENKWSRAYKRELNNFAEILQNRAVKSIFFGGGTPSLMSSKLVAEIIGYIGSLAKITDTTEITLEVNPTSAQQAKFRSFKLAGINRISIGVQSFNDSDLKILGRDHSSQEAIKTIEAASKIYNNYSFDLIYARPNQSLENWYKELTQALKYIKHHISLYQLTIEPDTVFASQYASGKFKRLENSIEAEMFRANQEILESCDIHQYEVSNYAVKGRESIHNLAYWNYDEYLGIGPGAHSRIVMDKHLYAVSIERKPIFWLKQLDKKLSTIKEKEALSKSQIVDEYILMNLRKTSGIQLADFRLKFDDNLFKYIDNKNLNSFKENGWICYNKDEIRVTNTGRIFLDTIIKYIIKGNE